LSGRRARSLRLALAAVLVFAFGAAAPLRGAPSVSAGELLRRSDAVSTLVPAGKVRHIVYGYSGARTFTQERWYANGQTHLLMRLEDGLSGQVVVL
jgi:hypothetical protein